MPTVLVVDDSALMRRLLGGVLRDAGFDVETARNGRDGLERLLETKPDVVTLDLNMPEMDGLTALSMMMQARPTPVVLVSSLTTAGATVTLEGLALGAVDFIAKPNGTISLSIDEIAGTLVAKVRAAARAKLRAPRTATLLAAAVAGRPPVAAAVATSGDDDDPADAPATPPVARTREPRTAKAGNVPGIVVIGVSTGGPRTLEDILPRLPADFPWPVVVAQHMPSTFTGAFAARMDRLCALEVVEVGDTVPLECGRVHIGRGGHDLHVIERFGRIAVQSRPESPAHLWHPSVELLVETAVRVFDPARIVAVQLTGMGNDGAAAMTALKQAGGRTIAESEETAVVFGMPADLIARGGASLVLPCGAIARQLIHWTRD
jgi:two-component system chemotaxis response regulator CheB